ncbi:MAG: stage V sporulation protein AE [Chloroflexota bacterium]
MAIVKAFLVGGALCLVAQLVLDLAQLNPAHVMVLFVSLGAIVSGVGLYEPLVRFAGAGATVPLPGFGHSLVQGIMKDVSSKGWLGLFTGGLTATAIGLSVAVVFGWTMSVLFNPKGK